MVSGLAPDIPPSGFVSGNAVVRFTTRDSATDPVDIVVEDWRKPAVRQDVFRKLERNFAVNLADAEQRLGSAPTIRDLASIVVKKSEL